MNTYMRLKHVCLAMDLVADVRDDLEPEGPSELFRLALEAGEALTDLAEALRPEETG